MSATARSAPNDRSRSRISSSGVIACLAASALKAPPGRRRETDAARGAQEAQANVALTATCGKARAASFLWRLARQSMKNIVAGEAKNVVDAWGSHTARPRLAACSGVHMRAVGDRTAWLGW
jgi:hypothetical protein